MTSPHAITHNPVAVRQQSTWLCRKKVERKRSGRSPSVVMRCAAEASTSDDANVGGGMDRRRVLLGAASLAAASGAGVTVGARSAIAAELSREYRDEEDKYSFKVPGSWEMATGTTSPNPQSTRRVVAFYPPSSPEINVSVVCTSLGADYTRMGSFGSVDEFAFGVAAGMAGS